MGRRSGKRQQRLPWLTFRQQLFVVAFVGPALGNATTAYEMAGFRATGASRTVNASKLLRNANVAKAIEELTAECKARLQERGEEEMALLRTLMRFTVLDLYDDEGKPIPIWKLPPHVAAAIKGIRPTKHGTVLEFRDTVHPAEVRLRVLGKLKETVKIERSLEEIIAAANVLETEREQTPNPADNES